MRFKTFPAASRSLRASQADSSHASHDREICAFWNL
jgi:hypothetical protein